MYYFAWVTANDTSFDPAFSREDENVFAFEITHSEGDFATLTIQIKNPNQSLANKVNNWAWLSVDGTPLFFGRLVAVPEHITEEIVSLSFIARPVGYDQTKAALADTMRVAPFYDEIWLTDEALENPDTVLEARAELWHIDRVTLDVTTSSIVNGEDGVLEFGPANIIYDSLNIEYATTPLRTIRVEAEISWDQTADGVLSISKELIDAFEDTGSTGRLISSYTGQGLEEDWPEAETNLKGGWSVGTSILRRADGVWTTPKYKDVSVASMEANEGEEEGAKSTMFLRDMYRARFYLWEFRPTFELAYDVARQRIERVSFEISADVQSILTEPGDEAYELLTLSSQKVSEPIVEGEPPAIGDTRRRAYLTTDRGRQSVEYLIMIARASLLSRARAVDVTIRVPFAEGLALSCRKNAHIQDARLPNGEATGKISVYTLAADGDGSSYAELTVSCTVGNGNTVEAVAGEPAYFAEGYADPGYQLRTGQTIMPVAGEVTYEDYTDTQINDDGINFIDMKPNDVILRLDVLNGKSDQDAILAQRYADIAAAVEALNASYTEVWLELKPLVGGPFETVYNLQTSNLMVPQMISL